MSPKQSKPPEPVDILSDAQRSRDLIVRAVTLVDLFSSAIDKYEARAAREEIEKFSILAIEGIATRASRAAKLDPPRFGNGYGPFYAAMESLERTLNRIEGLDEEGNLEAARMNAAVNLIATSVKKLRMEARQFDEVLGEIHARDYVETVVPASGPAQQAIQEASGVDSTNIAQVAASQLTISNSYYENVLMQARHSFTSAIAAAIAGLAFFMAGVIVSLLYKVQGAAVISTLSGAIVETIAGLNFWLYARTSQQLESFHRRLERMQRYLVANSVGEGLRGKARDIALSDLITVIATGRETESIPGGQESDIRPRGSDDPTLSRLTTL